MNARLGFGLATAHLRASTIMPVIAKITIAVRTRSRVSVNEALREGKWALALREKVRRLPAHFESCGWAGRWPGTSGGGPALVLSYPGHLAPTLFPTWGHVLTTLPEDVQLFDSKGLVAFSVHHESLLFLRSDFVSTTSPLDEAPAQLDPAATELCDFLRR
jgi:hypothetical protein